MTAATTSSDEADFIPVEITEALTPIQIEQALNQLMNAVAKNQIMLMQLRSAEVDSKIAYERKHLNITMGDECPRVARGGTTVAERDDWIRDKEFAEYEAYEQAKKRTKNCRDYMEMLQQQCSLVQSMNKSVVASYYGASGTGGH